jgi:hypothetical protein
MKSLLGIVAGYQQLDVTLPCKRLQEAHSRRLLVTTALCFADGKPSLAGPMRGFAVARAMPVRRGLHQSDVAERLGKLQSYVSNVESEERRLDVVCHKLHRKPLQPRRASWRNYNFHLCVAPSDESSRAVEFLHPKPSLNLHDLRSRRRALKLFGNDVLQFSMHTQAAACTRCSVRCSYCRKVCPSCSACSSGPLAGLARSIR